MFQSHFYVKIGCEQSECDRIRRRIMWKKIKNDKLITKNYPIGVNFLQLTRDVASDFVPLLSEWVTIANTSHSVPRAFPLVDDHEG